MIIGNLRLKFIFALALYTFSGVLWGLAFAKDRELQPLRNLGVYNQGWKTSAQQLESEPFERPGFGWLFPERGLSTFEVPSTDTLGWKLALKTKRTSRTYVRPVGPVRRPLTLIPKLKPKRYIDAGDLRDPFLLLRGYEDNTANPIRPGETLDGERFYSYSNSRDFIDKNYRDSGFALNDIFGRVIVSESTELCMRCHYGIEEISKNHKFRCTKCHGGNGNTSSKKKAHRKMVSNPSDLKYADKYCGKCHADQVTKVKASLMATAKGVINFTRYALGVQGSQDPPFSLFPTPGENLFPKRLDLAEEVLNGTEEVQVENSAVINHQGPMIDRYLRESCLRCHLQSPSPHRPGDYRSTGCAACHMIYTNDGRTVTRDRAIQNRQKARVKSDTNQFLGGYSANGLRNQRGYPVVHKFTVAVPSVQCEHCHHLNGPGNEFEGRFVRSPLSRPAGNKVDALQPVLHGARHDFLVPDIHREKGMHCIDCHGQREIKAGGPDINYQDKAVQIRCENCHGTTQKPPIEILLVESLPQTKAALKSASLNPNLMRKIKPGNVVMADSKGHLLYHIKKETSGWVLISKVTGKKHKLPILQKSPKISAHQLKSHMDQVECSACHAAWSANEWGTHLIYEDKPDWKRWNNWGFSDPVLQNLFLKRLTGENEQGSSLNWLTVTETKKGIQGEWEQGIWLNLTSESDWKTMLLGKNSRGKYSIMKPRHQYWYSRKSSDGSLVKARMSITQDGGPGLFMVPYSPHTIRRTARACESCHGNEEALGLGNPRLKRILDGAEFLRRLETGEKPLPYFQLKQLVAPDGQALQTVWPLGDARFLNPEEILSLSENSDRYRAYRYFNLRERGFPRLLSRQVFPEDRKRLAEEAKTGGVRRDEDYYFDLERGEFYQNKILPEPYEPEAEEIIPPLVPQ
tara:strand:+ start:1453 stop:4197 length:2745 start_codon:yes stop_codon:yes gene_type:complete